MKLATSIAILLFAAGAAGAEPSLEGELIFPGQDKHCHGSSIVECPNGDLLAVWFFGSGERTADDVCIQGARRKAGQKQWSPVFTAADTPGFPDCNPVLWVDGQKRLWLFWIPVLAHRWENSLLKYRISEDYQGDRAPRWTWQDVILLRPGAEFAESIEAGFRELRLEEGLWAEYAPQYSTMILEAAADPRKRQIGWMTRIHPLTLPSGRILLPLYSHGFNVSLAAISDDGGQTWRASRPIVGLGPIQPTLVRRRDGTIVAYLRDSGGAPQRVMSATSADQGETWSVAGDTDIPNPGSSLEVIALADETWVMVFNDTEDGRYRLALALSDNEGRSWKWKRHLEQAEQRQGSFAYPSMIQARDGLLHLTYTHNVQEKKSIKHVAVSPEWILRGP